MNPTPRGRCLMMPRGAGYPKPRRVQRLLASSAPAAGERTQESSASQGPPSARDRDRNRNRRRHSVALRSVALCRNLSLRGANPQVAQISADDEASCSCSKSIPMTSTASLSTNTSTRLSDAWSAVTRLSLSARSFLRSVSVHPSQSSASLLRKAATSRAQSTSTPSHEAQTGFLHFAHQPST